MKKLFAEFIGTFVLVLFGCGTAVLAGGYVGFAGIALAFGLAVFVMAYAVGHISGGHFNPAVSVGMAVAGRFSWKSVIPYVISQVLGGAAAAAILYVIATGTVIPTEIGGFAANTFSNYTFAAAVLTELVLTAVFVLVILGATAKESFSALGGAAIGLALTAIHLVSIPVTNTSVNPARSTSQALFSADPAAMSQLWVFWVAPIAGAIIGGLIWKYMLEVKKARK